MVKVSDSLVDVTNLRSAGMLELFAEGLNLQRRCQSIVGALMATGTLSKLLSKPSTLGTTPLIAMFQSLPPPLMEMLAVQPMEVLAVQSAAQRDSSLRMAETVQLQTPMNKRGIVFGSCVGGGRRILGLDFRHDVHP